MLKLDSHLDVVKQRQTRLRRILRLDKQQLVFLQLGDDALVVPAGDHVLHVHVGGEEADDAVRHHRHQVHQQVAVVADHRRVLAGLELGGDGHLVVSFGDDLAEGEGDGWR